MLAFYFSISPWHTASKIHLNSVPNVQTLIAWVFALRFLRLATVAVAVQQKKAGERT
jgi:hypothetical protein